MINKLLVNTLIQNQILWLKTILKNCCLLQLLLCTILHVYIHNSDLPVNLHTGDMYLNPVKHCSPISQGYCFQHISSNQFAAMKETKGKRLK